MKNRSVETFVESEHRTEVNASTETYSLLELITEGKSSGSISADGVIVGKFTGFDRHWESPGRFRRRHFSSGYSCKVDDLPQTSQIGSDVVLAFEHGDLEKPIITGSLWQPENSLLQEPVVAEARWRADYPDCPKRNSSTLRSGEYYPDSSRQGSHSRSLSFDSLIRREPDQRRFCPN